MTITIETGFPIPKGRQLPLTRYGELRCAIEAAVKGQSFMIQTERDQNHCYRIADEIGCHIKTQKQTKGGWRVWKL